LPVLRRLPDARRPIEEGTGFVASDDRTQGGLRLSLRILEDRALEKIAGDISRPLAPGHRLICSV